MRGQFVLLGLAILGLGACASTGDELSECELLGGEAFFGSPAEAAEATRRAEAIGCDWARES